MVLRSYGYEMYHVRPRRKIETISPTSSLCLFLRSDTYIPYELVSYAFVKGGTNEPLAIDPYVFANSSATGSKQATRSPVTDRGYGNLKKLGRLLNRQYRRELSCRYWVRKRRVNFLTSQLERLVVSHLVVPKENRMALRHAELRGAMLLSLDCRLG